MQLGQFYFDPGMNGAPTSGWDRWKIGHPLSEKMPTTTGKEPAGLKATGSWRIVMTTWDYCQIPGQDQTFAAWGAGDKPNIRIPNTEMD